MPALSVSTLVRLGANGLGTKTVATRIRSAAAVAAAACIPRRDWMSGSARVWVDFTSFDTARVAPSMASRSRAPRAILGAASTGGAAAVFDAELCIGSSIISDPSRAGDTVIGATVIGVSVMGPEPIAEVDATLRSSGAAGCGITASGIRSSSERNSAMLCGRSLGRISRALSIASRNSCG